MSLAENALLELIATVDTSAPSATEVRSKLRKFAQAVIQGGARDRENVISLGAYAVVCQAWIYNCESEIRHGMPGGIECQEGVLEALYALTPGNPQIIDEVGWQIITLAIDSTMPEQTHTLVLKLLRNVFIKSEENRETFSWSLIHQLIALIRQPRITSPMICEWCSAVKAFFLSDDPRMAYNRAAERKQPIVKANVLPRLSDFLNQKEFDKDARTMNAVVILLASMAVSEEICLQMESNKVLEGIHGIFRNHFDNKTLMRNTVSLLRLLCVCRKLRNKSAERALMKWVVNVLDKYKEDPDIVEEVMSCLSYMTLNNPCQVAQFMMKNGLPLAGQLLKTYSQDISIVKAICFTLRNVAENGGGHAKEKLKDGGYEPILKEIMTKSPGLEQLYVTPILTELRRASSANITAHTAQAYTDPPTEPQPGRQSVVLDDGDNSF